MSMSSNDARERLKERLARAKQNQARAGGRIQPRADAGAAPVMTAGQRRMWITERMQSPSPAYSVAIGLRLRGPLDVERVVAAVDAVIARHEVLRTRYPVDENGDARVVVDPADAVDVRRIDVSDAAEPVSAAERAFAALLAEPFDVTSDVLHRAALIALAPDDHVLALTMHHIVADGWSIEILGRHLREAYEGKDLIPDAGELTFADYASWEASAEARESMARGLEHWKRTLADVEPLQLSISADRPAIASSAGGVVERELDADAVARLLALGRESGATAYMTMLGVTQLLLHKYSGSTTFAIGTSVAGRSRQETEPIVGMFVNMIAVPARLDATASFAEHVTAVRASALEAFAHQDIAFDEVVRALSLPRDPSMSPVFQVTMSVDELGTAAGDGRRDWAGGVRVDEFGAETSTTHYDLGIHFSSLAERPTVTVSYRTSLYRPDQIEALLDGAERLIDGIVTSPERDVRSHALVAPAAVASLAASGQGPARPAGASTLIDLLTRAHADERIAIRHEREEISHRVLHARAVQMSHLLADAGVGPGDRVAVAPQNPLDAAICILGTLFCGASYVPLDPKMPQERLEFILDDADVSLLIGDADLCAAIEHPSVDITTITQELLSQPSTPLDLSIRPEHPAYTIYTSGTTGTPKGVEVSHGDIAAYLEDIAVMLDVVDGADYALLQSLVFDFSLLMFYLPLIHGGTLHFLPGRTAGAELAEQISQAGIDYIKLTPSHLVALRADVELARLLPKRGLVMAGEALHIDDLGRAADESGCIVLNSYGPTETVVACTVDRVSGPATTGASWPIGAPMPGERVYVLDSGLAPVPDGVAGELYVGGRLARGYVGRPGITASRFVSDPFAADGQRMYRTGDRVRRLPDGRLEFLGRSDDQVKVRGYRVELGEIEAVLDGAPGVAQTVVDLRGGRLVAYVRFDSGAASLDEKQLRAVAERILPDYMVPRVFVPMETFPLKSHGKVDRRALPDPVLGSSSGEHVAPRDEVEAAIAAAFAEVLSIELPSVHDDFFEIGGDSLLATKLVPRLRPLAASGAEAVSVMDLFTHSTVARVAELLAQRREEEGSTRLLYELTRPVDPARRRFSIICAPYGGANASVFKKLADTLPGDVSLYAIEVPGHDIGNCDSVLQPTQQVADQVVAEILERVEGRLVVYGHCNPGSALAAAVAQGAEAAGREVDAVYIGGAFPVARPSNRVLDRLSRLTSLDRITADRNHQNWMAGMGAGLDELDAETTQFAIRTMRDDGRLAEEYFTERYREGGFSRISAPVISIVGTRDPAAEFYEERYQEWSILSDTTAVAVLDEAGHFYVQHRAQELGEMLMTVHELLDRGDAEQLLRARRGDGATWWLHDAADAVEPPTTRNPQPRMRSRFAGGDAAGTAQGMGRFSLIAIGQLMSFIGSTLFAFALPLWVMTETNDLFLFGLLQMLGLLPGVLLAPLFGAIVDRANRRWMVILADAACGALQVVLLVLALTGSLAVWNIFIVFPILTALVNFQRVAFQSAIPQIVPKRNLGHANGLVQAANGFGTFVAPLVGVGLLALFGMETILYFTIGGYVLAVAIMLLVRFPGGMPQRQGTSMLQDIWEGLKFSLGTPHLRAMLIYFACVNLFLSPMIVLSQPLTLAFGTLTDVAIVSAVAGVAGILGGLTMTVWGGPRVRRMDAMRAFTVVLALSGLVVAAYPSVWVVSAGIFGVTFVISVVNSLAATVIQSKVPQRLQGRVFSVNQTIASIAGPIGFGFIAPGLSGMYADLLATGGVGDAMTGILGDLPGRSIALVYATSALALLALVIGALRWRALVRFDQEVPDAKPDDLLGIEATRDRRAVAPTSAPAAATGDEVAGSVLAGLAASGAR